MRRIHFFSFILLMVMVATAMSPGALAQSGSARHLKSPPPVLRVVKSLHLGKVLTNTKGMTLYRFVPDKHGKSVCMGTCAKIWPPYLVASSRKLIKPKGLPGKLGLIHRPGTKLEQVTYKGMPMYTFVHDKKPGQTFGQGLQKVWYVIRIGMHMTSSMSGNGW